MKLIKFYNKKTKKMDVRAKLEKGEQYDLMKRNNAMLSNVDTVKDITASEWERLFEDTVSFCDNGGGIEFVTCYKQQED